MGTAADLLKNADAERRRYGLDRMLVVDADVHHLNVLKHLAPYVEEPWRRMVETAPVQRLTPGNLGDRTIAGRIKFVAPLLDRARLDPADPANPPAPVRALVDDLARLGVDYSVLFPNDLLDLGAHPQPKFEVAVARAYARWLAERVLPYEPRVKSLLYLPFCDAEASLSLIDEFGDRPGVVGVLVTGVRRQRVDDNAYMRLYAALEERGLALGFHAVGYWPAYPFRLFDTFMAAHFLSFPFFNAIQLASLVLSGIPERFPKLRVVFFEAGATWLPMVMSRLDTAFLMRPSEAPLLTRRPSEYMREFFYTIQPIEQPDKPGQLEPVFDRIGRRQIMYASDYPHWDFDMPSSICDLGFLSDEDRRCILGLNAVRAFGLREEIGVAGGGGGGAPARRGPQG